MRLGTLFVFVSGLLLAQSDSLNRGIAAFKAGRYPDAAASFQRAADQAPAEVKPRLYLGVAYMSQYVPGSPDAENVKFARRAETEFQQVLKISPSHMSAMEYLGTLALQQNHLDEAQGWFERQVAVNPKITSAHFNLGVVAWTRAYDPILAARTKAGLPLDDTGPITNPAIRLDMVNRDSKVIEAGMGNLQNALALDPKNDDAMAYMHLLLRLRAFLRATKAEAQADVRKSDEWVEKAMAAKKERRLNPPDKVDPGPVVPTQALPLPPPPPPPPPPAPPAPEARRSDSPTNTINVSGAAQAKRLVNQAPPVYPPLAKAAGIQGQVKFEALIGPDGHVVQMKLVSGHPMLAQAAERAAQQWVYQPTLYNGTAVAVRTTIDVDFKLP